MIRSYKIRLLPTPEREAHLQRNVSRKYEQTKKCGKDYEKTNNIIKAEAKVKKAYYALANMRANYRHQVTHAHKCCGALKKRQQLLQNNENERYETDIGTSMVLNTTRKKMTKIKHSLLCPNEASGQRQMEAGNSIIAANHNSFHARHTPGFFSSAELDVSNLARSSWVTKIILNFPQFYFSILFFL